MASRAEFFVALKEDILSSTSRRKQTIANIAAQTHRFLGNFEAKRRAAAFDLRRRLRDGEETRLETFRQMRDGIVGRVTDLARDVRCKLGEFHNDSVAAHAAWNEVASARSGCSRQTTRRR